MQAEALRPPKMARNPAHNCVGQKEKKKRGGEKRGKKGKKARPGTLRREVGKRKGILTLGEHLISGAGYKWQEVTCLGYRRLGTPCADQGWLGNSCVGKEQQVGMWDIVPIAWSKGGRDGPGKSSQKPEGDVSCHHWGPLNELHLQPQSPQGSAKKKKKKKKEGNATKYHMSLLSLLGEHIRPAASTAKCSRQHPDALLLSLSKTHN